MLPYRYALTMAPAGMTIDPATGVITWPSPAKGKVEVALTVTDAVQASGNLLFVGRDGHLTADGRLVGPMPGKGHAAAPSSRP